MTARTDHVGRARKFRAVSVETAKPIAQAHPMAHVLLPGGSSVTFERGVFRHWQANGDVRRIG